MTAPRVPISWGARGRTVARPAGQIPSRSDIESRRFNLMTYFLWGVAALIAWVFLSDLREAFQAYASTRWPTETATVIESGWQYGYKGNYKPVVRYRYTVEGREFSASRIRFWGLAPYMGETSAQEWSNRWVMNLPAIVHYDPRHPEIAVLAPGFNWRIGLSLFGEAFGIAFFVAAALFLPL